MCSGSEAGCYLRRIHCVFHSTLSLRVILKKKKDGRQADRMFQTYLAQCLYQSVLESQLPHKIVDLMF